MSESVGPGEPVRLPGIIHIEEDISGKLNMLTVDTSLPDRIKQKPSWVSPYSR